MDNQIVRAEFLQTLAAHAARRAQGRIANDDGKELNRYAIR